ncbi:hypothetical protein DLD77_09830 [Chitinophaga alhagiae]|uniref:Glycoside hydrolase n=1 Tax=Chitinophaga alhagiae TaxID=2203219 RepID=A0ABM6WDF4_9BACT|nr:glycosyl hydrolase [Chitinophaga alhagiae]AWO01974.1 hypothetical protein DLD77_09830 [Chitinophaga alhagiae]
MRTNRLRLLAACVLLALAGHAQQTGHTFRQLQQQFATPGKQYGSAPLWVWNTRITKAEIDAMLADFKDKGFGGAIIHPRPGLITPYLSTEWTELYRYSVAKGKALGLHIWIYDENSYPSGFAGGHVPDQMPGSYNQGQMLQISKVEQLPADTKDVFICLKEESGHCTDITATMRAEQGKKGSYYLFKKIYYGKSGWYGGFSYVDLMVKGVTEKFLELTMKGYEQTIGKEFGHTVQGIFSDEPSIQTEGAHTIRWTPDLFSTFRQTWGYDLQPHLPSLFDETGNWKEVRHNYQQVLLQLFIDRWFKPMHAYTEKHGLKWTGHYWEHAWPNPNFGPDNMAGYAWHQQPGIDMLFNQFNETSPNAQFGNIRSVKELSSVANQLNKTRTLSETYGGGGWELTFKDMKRLADWEFVLGVNFLNQHLSWMTLAGARKGDYPPTFSYQNAWWEHYTPLNRYYARLSMALSQGSQHNEILVIEPTTSAWMYYARNKRHQRFEEIGQSFQTFVTRLEKAQVEYDLGSEDIIRHHGKVDGGRFVVGQRAYTTVVVPPGMENINAPTLALLQAYVAAGGKVLLFENLQFTDGRPLPSQTLQLPVQPALTAGAIRQHFQAADFEITAQQGDSIGGNLFHQRRRLDDGQLVFLVNSSMEHASTGRLKIKGKDALLLNLFSGSITNYPEQEEGGSITVNFSIPPAGSMLLFAAGHRQTGFAPHPLPAKGHILPAPPSQALRPENNTLMIDFCDVTFADTLMKDQHVTMAADIVFKHYGFSSGNPWNHEVQFKDRINEKDTFSTGTGFTATYRFTVSQGVPLNNITAVVERPGLWSNVLVNGTPVQPVKGQWWLDRAFGTFSIGHLLKPGENTVTLAIAPMSIHAEIEPVYILGDFNLAAAAKGWQIVPPAPLQTGSWKEQGLPLYGHNITYRKTVTLNTLNGTYAVQLGAWKGTVAHVTVNGKKAGIIFSEPDTLAITPLLRQGRNVVEVTVTGSLKNLLGPHHNQPKPGLVSPWHWRNIKHYPPGKDYDLYDYGLMEDFSIVQYSK